MVFQSNCISLKNTLSVPNNMPTPNTKILVTSINGITNTMVQFNWKFKKNMMAKNGINVSNKLITAANAADKGKLNGCKLMDFKIEALSIKEDKTCKIEADIKFQNIKPLRAYNEKFWMWFISLNTTVSMSKNNNGLSMLQKIPKKEFL